MVPVDGVVGSGRRMVTRRRLLEDSDRRCSSMKYVCVFVLWLFVCLRMAIGKKDSTASWDDCNENYVNILLSGNSRWLYGEVPVTGLTNQLTTIYSLLPLSRILNASLLIGFVYSRTTFEISMREFSKSTTGKKRLYLPEMIDQNSFQKLAESLGLNIQWQGASVFPDCFEQNISLSDKFVHNIQRRGWRSSSTSSIIDMVHNSGYDLQSSSYQYPQILRFKSVGKLLGLYNFQNDKNYQQLLHIHRNIHPAFAIQERVNMLLFILPEQYIALHARLEPDVIPRAGNWSSSLSIRNTKSKMQSSQGFHRANTILTKYSSLWAIDPNFFNTIAEWINSVVSSNCYKQYINSSLPSLYISSGMISSLYYPEDNKFHATGMQNNTIIDRGTIIKDVLAQMGFKNIFSKLDLRLVKPNLNSLPVELEGYVDLEVSRMSTCFIPAHLRSSFSYMVQRLRELDRNKPESAIGKPNGAYKVFFI